MMPETAQRTLPNDFKDLAPLLAKWGLGTNAARKQMRLSSTRDEMNAFYRAIAPRLDAALDYLNQFSLGEMPEEEQALLDLTLSAAEIAIYVEWFGGEVVPPTARGLANRVKMVFEPVR